MTVVLAAVAGLLVGGVVLWGAAGLAAHPTLLRDNYRGMRLPTAGGTIIVVAAVVVEGGRALLRAAGVDEGAAGERVVVLAAVVGYGFLGLLDDLVGDPSARGLRGHLGALLHGRLTTGAVKLLAGAALGIALAGVGAADDAGLVRVVVDGVLIAGAANLANLFDRAPGRTLKIGISAAAPLLVAAGNAGRSDGAAAAGAVVVGAALVLLPHDVGERLMLGDTGANAMGGALGVVAVLSLGASTRTAVAVVVVALTLLSEVVSFSRVIEATPPLRALDQLGRHRRTGPSGPAPA